jgi:hypothetical protein
MPISESNVLDIKKSYENRKKQTVISKRFNKFNTFGNNRPQFEDVSNAHKTEKMNKVLSLNDVKVDRSENNPILLNVECKKNIFA